MSVNDPVQDQKPTKNQFNQILDKYVEQRHVHIDSTESLIEFKKKIDIKETTVSSAKEVIQFLKSLEDGEKELWDSELIMINELDSLIEGSADFHVLDNDQLKAFKCIKELEKKYRK